MYHQSGLRPHPLLAELTQESHQQRGKWKWQWLFWVFVVLLTSIIAPQLLILTLTFMNNAEECKQLNRSSKFAVVLLSFAATIPTIPTEDLLTKSVHEDKCFDASKIPHLEGSKYQQHLSTNTRWANGIFLILFHLTSGHSFSPQSAYNLKVLIVRNITCILCKKG